jgi:hypothetical protein
LSEWITGAIEGIDPRLLSRLEKVAIAYGQPIDVRESKRSREEQQRLWDESDKSGRYVAHPDKSRHTGVVGFSADIRSKWFNDLENDALEKFGLHKPMWTQDVRDENWHVEPAETMGKTTQQLNQEYLGGQQQGGVKVANNQFGIQDPTTGQVTIIPINMPPQKTYESVIPEGFIGNLFANTPIKSPKQAESEEVNDLFRKLVEARFYGSNSPEMGKNVIDFLQPYVAAKVAAAGEGANIQNTMATRDSLAQLYSLFSKIQDPMESNALGMAIETLGGPKNNAPEMAQYGWQTPNQASNNATTIATTNANNNVNWKTALMNNNIREQELAQRKQFHEQQMALEEMKLGLDFQKMIATLQSKGSLSVKDISDLANFNQVLRDSIPVYGDTKTWFAANQRRIATIAALEYGRPLSPDELKDYIKNNYGQDVQPNPYYSNTTDAGTRYKSGTQVVPGGNEGYQRMPQSAPQNNASPSVQANPTSRGMDPYIIAGYQKLREYMKTLDARQQQQLLDYMQKNQAVRQKMYGR